MPERAKRETIAVKHAPRGARLYVIVSPYFLNVSGALKRAKTGVFFPDFGLPKLA